MKYAGLILVGIFLCAANPASAQFGIGFCEVLDAVRGPEGTRQVAASTDFDGAFLKSYLDGSLPSGFRSFAAESPDMRPGLFVFTEPLNFSEMFDYAIADSFWSLLALI